MCARTKNYKSIAISRPETCSTIRLKIPYVRRHNARGNIISRNKVTCPRSLTQNDYELSHLSTHSMEIIVIIAGNVSGFKVMSVTF